MSTFEVVVLTPTHPDWPSQLTTRLGNAAPTTLTALGNISLLSNRKAALFCSVGCPGDAILAAQDAARHWRDARRCVISGFHSPVEKECLYILLRGEQPIIFCPARAIKTMRAPTECRAAFDAGRLLFLSPFTEQPTRITRESALRRNEFVAALADEVFVAHITPGGETERIAGLLRQWEVPGYVAH